VSNHGTQHARQEANATAVRKSPFSFSFVVALLLVAGLLFGPFLYSQYRNAVFEAKNLTQQVELIQLRQALENYTVKMGQFPPPATRADIEAHLRQSNCGFDGTLSQLGTLENNLDDLDERETLVFWLGGEAGKTIFISPKRMVHFEFDLDQLTDIDNDGWPEYKNAMNRYFILRNEEVYLYDISLDKAYSLEDLQGMVSE